MSRNRLDNTAKWTNKNPEEDVIKGDVLLSIKIDIQKNPDILDQNNDLNSNDLNRNSSKYLVQDIIPSSQVIQAEDPSKKIQKIQTTHKDVNKSLENYSTFEISWKSIAGLLLFPIGCVCICLFVIILTPCKLINYIGRTVEKDPNCFLFLVLPLTLPMAVIYDIISGIFFWACLVFQRSCCLKVKCCQKDDGELVQLKSVFDVAFTPDNLIWY